VPAMQRDGIAGHLLDVVRLADMDGDGMAD
jgi:hypothetical protein